MNEINELLDEFEDLKIKNLKVYEAPTSLFGKIKAGFNTVINKVKSSDFGRRCAALVLAGTMTFSLAGCAGKTQAEDANDNYAIVETQLSNFDNMLNKSQSEIQKATLGSVKDFLVYFNTTFSDDHIEPDKDIRAALSWDEVIALTTLYNDFSNQDIIQIYNGADLDSYQMLTDYKTGFLILMGAHVLENSSVPVKLDMLLQTQEAKDYYNKYHDLFLAAKESTGETQLNYVKNFFAQVRADFPISMESRRSNVGIAHADPRNGLKDYYYSILPMLSAAEIMFQNLDIDYTLNDEEIALINELGICNLAESRYNNVALLAATAGKKSEYADYEALKKELESVLTLNGTYVIDDAHRELTLLDEFFEKIKDGLKKSGGYWIISTSTYTVVTREEVESREEAIRRAGEEKVKDAEEAVDNAFKDENDKAKAEAEGKPFEEKRAAFCVRYGLDNVTKLVEKKKAKLVLIANDVDPLELVMWLPALCHKMGVAYAIVAGKAKLGALVHQKTATCVCLTGVNPQDEAALAACQDTCNTHSKIEKKWGGGIMGLKTQRKLEIRAAAVAAEKKKKESL